HEDEARLHGQQCSEGSAHHGKAVVDGPCPGYARRPVTVEVTKAHWYRRTHQRGRDVDEYLRHEHLSCDGQTHRTAQYRHESKVVQEYESTHRPRHEYQRPPAKLEVLGEAAPNARKNQNGSDHGGGRIDRMAEIQSELLDEDHLDEHKADSYPGKVEDRPGLAAIAPAQDP